MFAHLLHLLASLHLHYGFSECVLFSMNSSPKTTPLLTPLSEDSGTVLHCSTSYTFHWSTVHTTDVNIRNISVHFEFCSIRHGYSKHITSSVSLEMCKRHVTNTIFLHSMPTHTDQSHLFITEKISNHAESKVIRDCTKQQGHRSESGFERQVRVGSGRTAKWEYSAWHACPALPYTTGMNKKLN